MRDFRIEVFYISCYEDGYKLFVGDEIITMDFGWCKYWAERCYDNGQEAEYGFEKWLEYELKNISKVLSAPLSKEEIGQVSELLRPQAFRTINWWMQEWRKDEYNRINRISC